MNNLSPEEREIGRGNYYSAVTAHDNIHRRDFMVRSIAAGGMAAAGVGGMYFGYHQPRNPVRICIIGTGDEGNVLIGGLNPDYVQVKSICDIRPSSIHRAFHGPTESMLPADQARQKGIEFLLPIAGACPWLSNQPTWNKL